MNHVNEEDIYYMITVRSDYNRPINTAFIPIHKFKLLKFDRGCLYAS